MTSMRPRSATRASLRAQAGIKLARLLELPEGEFETKIREIEADPLFRRLSDAGVISVQPLPRARFGARALDGRHLRVSDDGLGELLDGDGDFARLMRRVGQAKFEASFLGDAALSDAERAEACGISREESRTLREFVDQVYVRSEFSATEDRSAPSTIYSSVAGISVEDGQPILGFFNREIWKGRYQTDAARYSELKASLSARQVERMEQFMRQVELLAFRQTTLFRVLEVLIEVQKPYLVSGDPDRRSPLTQLAVAKRLAVAPSVLNQLISNKSVELPWRLEIPLKTLLPSRKKMVRDKLYELAIERPDAGDEVLREELHRLHGTMLSRPSIIQYRKELGLGSAGHRGPEVR